MFEATTTRIRYEVISPRFNFSFMAKHLYFLGVNIRNGSGGNGQRVLAVGGLCASSVESVHFPVLVLWVGKSVAAVHCMGGTQVTTTRE